MRRIIIPLLAIFSLLFVAIWFYAKTTLSAAIGDMASAQETQSIRIGAHDITGFPASFTADLRDVAVLSETGTPLWEGETLVAGVDSYNPTRLTVQLPDTQVITLAGSPITLNTADMVLTARASLGLFLPLEFATLAGRDLEFVGPTETRILAEAIALDMTHVSGETYDLTGSMTSITLPDDMREMFDPDGSLPAQIDGLTFDARATLTNMITRMSAETIPKIKQLDLRALDATWGPLGVQIKGLVDVDPSGFLNGTLTVTVRNYDILLERLIAAGLIPSNQRFLVQMVARSASDGGPDLTVPITFTDGEAMLGGLVPLGVWQIYRQ